MQEHVSKKLINAEVTGQEEMKTHHRSQVYATTFKDIGSYKRQDIDDEKILGHCWYIVHNRCFLFVPYMCNYYYIRPQNY